MKIGIVVQARMASARLPGKVLMPLAGRPVLAWLIERMQRVRAGSAGESLPVVVATSLAPEDEPVEALARSLSVDCHRGPLEDVAARLAQAADAAGFTAFVRANADSPLLDPALIGQAHALYMDDVCDLVSNVSPRTFPKGMSVELIGMDAMQRILGSTSDAQDREHVTRFAYAHPNRFKIMGFSAPRPRPDLQLSIDTPEDFARMQACISRLGARAIEAGWEEIADCAAAPA